ncbi:hypothetical protein WJX72_006289 [[Myrmecia] bisecta]|uniref:Uncharacterized protein n=1 Tax=[Myrmecia] bisecta TaxID=41462 RepID=A0AAW1Q7K4_9CHLO
MNGRQHAVRRQHALHTSVSYNWMVEKPVGVSDQGTSDEGHLDHTEDWLYLEEQRLNYTGLRAVLLYVVRDIYLFDRDWTKDDIGDRLIAHVLDKHAGLFQHLLLVCTKLEEQYSGSLWQQLAGAQGDMVAAGRERVCIAVAKLRHLVESSVALAESSGAVALQPNQLSDLGGPDWWMIQYNQTFRYVRATATNNGNENLTEELKALASTNFVALSYPLALGALVEPWPSQMLPRTGLGYLGPVSNCWDKHSSTYDITLAAAVDGCSESIAYRAAEWMDTCLAYFAWVWTQIFGEFIIFDLQGMLLVRNEGYEGMFRCAEWMGAKTGSSYAIATNAKN